MIVKFVFQEAKQILNVSDVHNNEDVQKKADHLFSINEKSKGGSFYIQSKVSLKAKNAILAHLFPAQDISINMLWYRVSNFSQVTHIWLNQRGKNDF